MADAVRISLQIQGAPRHDPIKASGNQIPIQDRESRKQAVKVVHLANCWIRGELGNSFSLVLRDK
jgi:hypothetical protein